LQLAYDFYKEGELTAEELDEQYCLQKSYWSDWIQKCFRTKDTLVLLYK
jgi:uncharacterized protein YnzC (UPF0291/DUF896 family)